MGTLQDSHQLDTSLDTHSNYEIHITNFTHSPIKFLAMTFLATLALYGITAVGIGGLLTGLEYCKNSCLKPQTTTYTLEEVAEKRAKDRADGKCTYFGGAGPSSMVPATGVTDWA